MVFPQGKILLSTISLAALMVNPTLAHQVELAADVGATLHIEPDDVAQAGEPTQVWFALTRQGGKLIPLSVCDCRLQIFVEPRSPDDAPILAPSLTPTEAEGQRHLPSANFTFPAVGAYQLVLSGTAKNGVDFAPFELTFTTLVAANQSPPQSTPETVTVAPTAPANPTPQPTVSWWGMGIMSGSAIAGLVFWWRRRK